MKKTLVTLLALVFVLGIAGTALAAPANPFVDVPAKHWAYNAVTKLAQAGIVDGYGDGTFRGDRTMTRYEMAQIVAKAMARSDKADAENKALIDKLAVEFAAELNNLGVRVAKLEKNASTIKLSGDARLRWVHQDKGADNPTFAQRFRLVAQADINDTVSFYGRWQVLNHNTMGTYSTDNKKVNDISDAYLSMKQILPNIDLKAGRYEVDLGETTYFAGTTGGMDGAELTWKQGKAALQLGYVDPGALLGYTKSDITKAYDYAGYGNLYYGQLAYKFDNNAKMSAWYMKNQDKGDIDKLINSYGVGFTYGFGNDWKIIADYWKNTADDAGYVGGDPTGQVYRLQYGAVKPAVPGSWQASIEYNKFEAGAVDGAFTGSAMEVANLKAWMAQYAYTLARNVTLEAYYQFNMKKADSGDDYYKDGGNNKTRVQVNYMF